MGELEAEEERAKYERLPTVYLERRRPCFLCSRSLQRIGRGPNRGLYAAKEVEIDGIMRYVHGRCGDLQDHELLPADELDEELR